jgi:cytochrome c oxidase subunit II
MEDIVKQVDETFIYISGACLLLLVLVTAAMIFFLFKYRESRNPQPADIRGNWLLETAWLVVPTIIALVMFYFGWQSFLGLRSVPPNAIPIEVKGMQFAWAFVYPNHKQSEGLLVVPQGKPVKLTLTSLDVIHGFYIPAFRIKTDVIKNMQTHAWFYADKPGDYDIFCTQYCGVAHADMRATLRIVAGPEYEAWLQKK